MHTRWTSRSTRLQLLHAPLRLHTHPTRRIRNARSRFSKPVRAESREQRYSESKREQGVEPVENEGDCSTPQCYSTIVNAMAARRRAQETDDHKAASRSKGRPTLFSLLHDRSRGDDDDDEQRLCSQPFFLVILVQAHGWRNKLVDSAPFA